MICANSRLLGGAVEGGVEDEGQEAVWLSSQDVADRWHVHINSVRLWADSGKLPVHRLPGKFTHRRFLLSECEQALGCPRKVEKEEQGAAVGAIKVAIYARTSTSKQSKGFTRGQEGSDLARQVERLKAYCLEKYGVEPIELADTGSGLSFSRKGLRKLMAMLLDGSLDNGVIVCTHVDRLARWGSELILQVAKSRNCEVVFCEKEEVLDADEMASIATEVIQVLTHVAAKYHGRRAAKTLEAPLSAETIREALKLKAEGMSASQAAKILRAKGHTNGKGRHVNWYSFQSLFETCGGDTLNTLLDGEVPTNSLAEFASQHIQPDKGGRLYAIAIRRAYALWCKQQGKIPVARGKAQDYLYATYEYGIYRGKKAFRLKLV